MVCLLPLSRDDVTTVAGWLARPEVCKWLDFGPRHEQLDTLALKFMLMRPQDHVLFTFTPEAGGQKNRHRGAHQRQSGFRHGDALVSGMLWATRLMAAAGARPARSRNC
jgi:hypothetical protein